VTAAAPSRADIEVAWSVARLRYKLYGHQRPAYDDFKARIVDPAALRAYALQWPRRVGKTFVAETIGVETCLTVPGARGVVIAPTEDMLEEFVIPTINSICADAPTRMRPRWAKSDGKFYFDHNGSHIALYGAKDDSAIDVIGRGPAAHFIIYEEAGHIANLKKVRQVASPQLLSNMHIPHAGWQLFVGTPPESTAHEFVKLCRAFKRDGRVNKLTIWESQYERDRILKHIEESADGMPLDEYMDTEDFRREFMAEFVSDPTRKVLKRATEKYLEECQRRYREVAQAGRPSHFAVIEAMDVGWAPDWTFWLIAWWHHRLQTLVVEKELFWREGFRHEDMASAIKAEEEKLLGSARVSPFHTGFRAPARWSDYSPILLAELADKHGLVFNPTAKDDRDTAISNCDRMISGALSVGKLAINPQGCPQLLTQMDAAVWGKGSRRKEFARDDMKRYGHYDGVAALIYLTRNVIRTEEPYPPHLWGVDTTNMFIPEYEYAGGTPRDVALFENLFLN
jgi:hypothetical protein